MTPNPLPPYFHFPPALLIFPQFFSSLHTPQARRDNSTSPYSPLRALSPLSIVPRPLSYPQASLSLPLTLFSRLILRIIYFHLTSCTSYHLTLTYTCTDTLLPVTIQLFSISLFLTHTSPFLPGGKGVKPLLSLSTFSLTYSHCSETLPLDHRHTLSSHISTSLPLLYLFTSLLTLCNSLSFFLITRH